MVHRLPTITRPPHRPPLLLLPRSPASCGRNFDELIRVIDSLQLTTYQKVTTPANWKQGDDVIVAPSVSDAEAASLFGDFQTIKPYLRTTKAPS